MVLRLLSVGAVALAVVLGGAVIAACYDVPTPDCGFVCGPDNACPDGYSCTSEQRCRRTDAPLTAVCSADAGGPHRTVGNPPDAPVDSPGGPPDPGVPAVSP